MDGENGHEYLEPRELMTTTNLIHVVKRSQMVFRCWRMRCALARCTHELKTGKRRPVAERPLEGTSTNLLHHVRASHGWSHETLDIFSLLSLCVGSFRSTSRGRVRDHVNNACVRDILMRSGGRHLVDICTWLIVNASSCAHIKPFGRETESVSEWKRVVFHLSPVLVSGHLCTILQFLGNLLHDFHGIVCESGCVSGLGLPVIKQLEQWHILV